MSTDIWRNAPRSIVAPGPSEVHVWRVSSWRDVYRPSLEKVLSPDEKVRAARYRQTDDRLGFVVRRGLLRVLLGRYLRCSPASLGFACNKQGKPLLTAAPAMADLQVNVSSSGDCILYGVARERAIGVDVERAHPIPDIDLFAETMFSPREVAILRRLPEEQKQSAFFHCWARKEAYIKAVGQGLSIPLDEFDVSLTPGEPARVVRPWREDKLGQTWSMAELPVGPGYAGAVAVEGPIGRLRCWGWPKGG